MKKIFIPCFASAVAAAVLASPTYAQTDAPTAEEAVQLDKLNVNEVPLSQQILPTSRPFNSVFGTDDNIVDVPRNVTIISRQQLSDISITDVLDFSKLTSSAFTTTNFGAPSNVSIRGQSADTFVNGVRARITSNGNGLPVDFNSVESVNIVKGPATAVQGTSMYVGGFIDLITKRPYFDAPKTSLSYTIGSYSTNKWTIDTGGPFSKQLAYRFSYSGEDSKGYYTDGHKKTHSIYGALTWRPTTQYELFLNAQIFIAGYTENWGVNRPTQNLIDNGMYQTGININDGPGKIYDPQNSALVKDGGNIIAWGPEVKLNRHLRLLKPGDNSNGHEFSFQAIQTDKVSNTLTVKNTTMFNYTARDTLSSYYYSEVIDPSMFGENRTDFIFDWGKYDLIAGLDLRYQRTKAYDDYFFEPANVWDITKDHRWINVYNSSAFYGRFVGQPIPGWPGRYATPGTINGDTNDSRGTTVGPFAQGSWEISDVLTFKAGVRYDFFSAKVREPLAPFLVGGDGSQKISVAIPNYNASLIYKPTPNSSVYFTYNKSENTSGAVGNGGGITGWAERADGSLFLDKESFTQPSELFEVGTKYALQGGKVFLNFAAYDQKRTAKATSSTVIQQFRYKGFEAEVNFQPSRRLYATLSYSYIDATSSAPFQYGLFGSYTELPPGNSKGTVDIGTRTRVSGLPRNLFNALISYKLTTAFTVSANTVVTGAMNNNAPGTLIIPTQYTLDLGASYAYKDWDFHVAVLNATDEENWSPPNAVYGNGSILALPGTQVQFTVKYKF
ncbi:MAG: TonB-dependent receptor [Opitutus sp.]